MTNIDDKLIIDCYYFLKIANIQVQMIFNNFLFIYGDKIITQSKCFQFNDQQKKSNMYT